MKVNMYSSLAVLGLGTVAAAGFGWAQSGAQAAPAKCATICVAQQDCSAAKASTCASGAVSTCASGTATACTSAGAVTATASGGGSCCSQTPSRAASVSSGGQVAVATPQASAAKAARPSVATTAAYAPANAQAPVGLAAMPRAAQQPPVPVEAQEDSNDALAERTAALEALLASGEAQEAEAVAPPEPVQPLRRSFQYSGKKLRAVEPAQAEVATEPEERQAYGDPVYAERRAKEKAEVAERHAHDQLARAERTSKLSAENADRLAKRAQERAEVATQRAQERAEADMRRAQEQHERNTAEAQRDLERAMRDVQRVREQELNKAQQEVERAMREVERVQTEVQQRVQREVQEAHKMMAAKGLAAQGGSEREGLEARIRQLEALGYAAPRAPQAQGGGGMGGRWSVQTAPVAPQGALPRQNGGQRSLEERVAELERRLGALGGGGGGPFGGVSGGMGGGAGGGVSGRTNDRNCTPARGSVMTLPRTSAPAGAAPRVFVRPSAPGAPSTNGAPKARFRGRIVDGGNNVFELQLGDGDEDGSVQIYGLDENGRVNGDVAMGWSNGDTSVNCDDESADDDDSSADDDDESADEDDDSADEDDGDEMWDDESADEDNQSGDDDDEGDDDADDDDDDGVGVDATTFNWNGTKGNYTFHLQPYIAKLKDLAVLKDQKFDFKAFDQNLKPLDAAKFNGLINGLTLNNHSPLWSTGVTTAAADQPAQASTQLKSLIDEMRAEVESLRSALGDLRQQVERRKQTQQGSYLR